MMAQPGKERAGRRWKEEGQRSTTEENLFLRMTQHKQDVLSLPSDKQQRFIKPTQQSPALPIVHQCHTHTQNTLHLVAAKKKASYLQLMNYVWAPQEMEGCRERSETRAKPPYLDLKDTEVAGQSWGGLTGKSGGREEMVRKGTPRKNAWSLVLLQLAWMHRGGELLFVFTVQTAQAGRRASLAAVQRRCVFQRF